MSAGLGRLVRVQPREVWANEAAHFTPWLAEPENVALLGETLGMDLEVEAVERAVGPFRADILCKDAGTDHLVLIENQLEASDHRHLGQILTYASGLDAFTIVWIATTIRDEHRATLDWLNEITASEVRFFALEVELWRIGASPPAPKFNVVCRPNDWTRSVKRGAAEVEDADPNGHRAEDAALWTALDARLDERDGPVVVPRQLSRSNWRNYRLGRINFGLSATVLRSRRRSALNSGSTRSSPRSTPRRSPDGSMRSTRIERRSTMRSANPSIGSDWIIRSGAGSRHSGPCWT